MRPVCLVWMVALPLLAPACARRDPVASAPAPAPPPVRVAKVVRADMPWVVETVGTARPSVSVQVRARVDGMIRKVHFKEGGEVKEGQLLFEIDSEAFESTLKEAEATLASSLGQEKLTLIEKDRAEKLTKAGASPVEVFDKARANHDNSVSAVARDRARLNVARLNLSYCKVTAPIAGIAGKLETDGGSLTRGFDPRPVVSINQSKPVYVEFALPERLLPQVRRAAAGPDPFLVKVRKSGQAEPLSGRVNFIDNQVDPATGTITLRAEFPNTDSAIWPGEFFEVAATLSIDRRVLTMPLTALGQGTNGAHAFVLGENGAVSLRPLKVQRMDRDTVIVAEGLSENELVVTEGAVRLMEGMTVRRVDAGPDQ